MDQEQETVGNDPEHSKPHSSQLSMRDQWDAKSVSDEHFAPWVLNIGFIFALLLSGYCLYVSAGYLKQYLSTSSTTIHEFVTGHEKDWILGTSLQMAITAELLVIRFSLLSCGLMVGMAFGFLGFALFLLGMKREMDVDAKSETYSIKVARIAPGAFVILCATCLIGVCVTERPEFTATYQGSGSGISSPSSGEDRSEPGDQSHQSQGTENVLNDTDLGDTEQSNSK